MIKKILISEEDRDYIQRLDIEMSARQSLIGFMLSSGMNIDTDQFRAYQDEYNHYFVEFDKAKREIVEKKYIEKEVENIENCSWDLNYNTREITVK